MSIPAPRYDIELAVCLSRPDASEAFRGISQNLSASGVLVRAERGEPLKTVLMLQFPVFAAEGEVIWARQAGDDSGILLGLRFSQLTVGDRRILLRILDSPELRAFRKFSA
jgi:hypothetical protein